MLDGRELHELAGASAPAGAVGVLAADRDGHLAVLGPVQVDGQHCPREQDGRVGEA